MRGYSLGAGDKSLRRYDFAERMEKTFDVKGRTRRTDSV